jgi:hypothetical protein
MDRHDRSALGTLREMRKMEEMHSTVVLEGGAEDGDFELHASQMAVQDLSNLLTEAGTAALRMRSECHLRPAINT